MAVDPVTAAKELLLRQAIAARPDAVALRYDLADLLIESDRHEEGVAEYRHAYALAPLLRPHSIALDPADRARMAPQTARLAAALQSHGVTASAVLLARAWSAAMLGDDATVRYLMDASRFVRIIKGAMPDLLTDAFRRALLAELHAGMATFELPWQAIRQANRNSTALSQSSPLGSLLADRLRRELDTYAASLGADDHPFTTARPARYTLQGWSVTFDGNSRHVSHIHPNGWLSGVLYLDTSGLAPGDAQRNGWLRIGSPEGIDALASWPDVWVEPEAGTLVLFPSYFPHETLPLGNQGARVCIAFDLVADTCFY